MIPTLEDIIRGLLNGTIVAADAQRWLEMHERQQRRVDAISYVPAERAACLTDVIYKCRDQDERWGSTAYPSFDPELEFDADTQPDDLADYHEVPRPRRARLTTTARGEQLSWMDLLVEEVAKVTEHHDDKPALRDQLIDVAGVAVQWASQLTVLEADHEGPGEE